MIKARNLQTLTALLLAILIVSYVVFCFLSFTQDHTRFDLLPLERVGILGQYKVGDDGLKLTLTDDTSFRDIGLETVYIYGHLSQDIPVNTPIMLDINNISVEMYQNGSLIYSYGTPGTFPHNANSSGALYASFASPGITTQDDIELRLTCFYTRQHPLQIRGFIDGIYAGSERALQWQLLRQDGFTLVLGTFSLCIGVILFIAAAVLLFRRSSLAMFSMLAGGFGVSCGIWFMSSYRFLSLIVPYPFFLNTIPTIALGMIIFFGGAFFASQSTGPRRLTMLIVLIIDIGTVVTEVIFQLFGVTDSYQFINFTVFLALLTSITALSVTFFESKSGNKNAVKRTLITFTPCLVCGFIYAVDFYLGSLIATKALQLGFLMTIVIQSFYLVERLLSTEREAHQYQQMENELLENKMSIMISQIQPHFLYNALNTIQYLCETDPNLASVTVNSFAKYLRGNMESLTARAPIPFSQELAHLKNYLSIECLRFGSRLKIVYRLECTDFMLPTLSVQPIVENAIRYGVTKKAAGGTVTIATHEDRENYYVIISDDGVGFDPDASLNDGRTHVGIANVRSRLKAQCGGFLEIKSKLGHGTTASLIIPKEPEGLLTG